MAEQTVIELETAPILGVGERAARGLGGLRPRLVPEGAVLFLVVLLAASFAIERVTPFDPYVGNPRDRLQPPALQVDFWNGHALGTDQQGRDVLARLLIGARYSFLVAALAIGLGGVVGLVLGMVAGYYGGAVDALIMRLVDLVLALPVIFVALILAATFRPSVALVSLALALNLWAGYARMIRGETLSLMHRDFIKLARIAGAGAPRILFTHVLPHVMSTFIVLLSLQVGVAILAESSLSFLGAGIPPPAPAWGSMAAQGREYIGTAWWVSFFPGVAILLVVLCFNLLGDWLRNRLPRR